ncbi:DUF411 domain-containing protein [Aurantimonas sp. HBX-1]|uniref:DUF411 domain-containing protein n=1 Tax=Aurantimonas sp. HBX-1 TaxID=2906072 RepID=UPI001F295A3A|nr:DUF411 domain-containing protein [Aurantimonas sp. HBX-1]UIJ71206.1 DUF411 domain-containing protein [Aurantimonas sp. HBX-1]
MKTLLAGAVLAASLLGSFAPAHADHADRHMTVIKSPTCGCCEAWVAIARKHGFDVDTEDTDELGPAKQLAGVPGELQSCHTARIGGYVVEGHVPMAAIDRLLAERPNIRGIAVPGMPIGSPGMGDDPQARFSVHAFGTSDGSQPVFHEAGR